MSTTKAKTLSDAEDDTFTRAPAAKRKRASRTLSDAEDEAKAPNRGAASSIDLAKASKAFPYVATRPVTTTTIGCFPARSHHAMVALPSGAVLVIGGTAVGPNAGRSDVWRSNDGGAVWEKVCDNAPWGPRWGHAAVALSNGDVVVLGGEHGTTIFNDVWASSDEGKTWRCVCASAPWSRRALVPAVALPDDTILSLGGWDCIRVHLVADVWKSSDGGATWSRVCASPAWTRRHGHAAVALPNGHVLLTGGYNCFAPPKTFEDVWRSTDGGATWERILEKAPFGKRCGHTMTGGLRDGKVVLVGGMGRAGQGDTLGQWFTEDEGKTWEQAMGYISSLHSEAQASCALRNGEMLVTGGMHGLTGICNDVTCTFLGALSWTRVVSCTRRTHQKPVVPTKGRLFFPDNTALDKRDLCRGPVSFRGAEVSLVPANVLPPHTMVHPDADSSERPAKRWRLRIELPVVATTGNDACISAKLFGKTLVGETTETTDEDAS